MSYKAVAAAARKLAKLADKPAETADWAIAYGEAWQDLSHAVEDAPPPADHQAAVADHMNQMAEARLRGKIERGEVALPPGPPPRSER